MTIQSQGYQQVFRGNSSATTFSFSFTVLDVSTLSVTYTDTNGNAQVISPSLYTVVLNAQGAGGLLTYPLTGSPIASGTTLLIQRLLPLTQTTSLGNQGSLWPVATEGALDNLEMQIQQVAGGSASGGLAVLFPPVDVNPTNTLPPAAARALKYFAFDAAGNPAMLTSSGATLVLLNVKDFGAQGNGSADDYVAITAAITAAAAAGSGVYFPPGNYKHGTQLTLKSGVVLWAPAGVTLTYSGDVSKAQITSPTTGCLLEAGIVGMDLNSGAAAKTVEVYSAWRCVFRDITFETNSATAICLDYLCNSSGSTNPDGNYNSVFNYTENLLQTGTCGTFRRYMGNTVSAPSQVVTLNTDHHGHALGVCVRGYDFAQYCDSNRRTGMHRVELIADNAVGEIQNSAVFVTINHAVYANTFEYFAVDTFTGFIGRIGLVWNESKYCGGGIYYNSPVAEGGSYSLLPNCHSYDFLLVQDEDNGDGKTNVMRRITNASIKSTGGAASADLDIGTDFGSTKDLRLFGGGYMQARVRHDIAAVNWLDFFGAVTGTPPVIQAEGSDANVGITMWSKGTSPLVLGTNQGIGGKNLGLSITHVNNAVNYIELQENISGSAPVLRGAGSDVNVNLALQSKGTGSLLLGTNSTTNQARVLHTDGATNTVDLTGSNGGNPKVSASGGNLELASALTLSSQTVGTTVGAAGAATALPALPLGYITVPINGTTVKIPYYNP